MMFNVICMFGVVFMGGAVEIYTFSNVGYLASFLPVLIGYYLLRKDRPNLKRPFRLPEYFKYVALGLAFFYAIIYFYGEQRLRVLSVLRGPNTSSTTPSGSARCLRTSRSTGTERGRGQEGGADGPGRLLPTPATALSGPEWGAGKPALHSTPMPRRERSSDPR